MWPDWFPALTKGVGEAEVRNAFRQFGELTSCDLSMRPPLVRFATHTAALAAIEAKHAWAALCEVVDVQYNERSYDGRCDDQGGRANDSGRGWCVLRPLPLFPPPASPSSTRLA